MNDFSCFKTASRKLLNPEIQDWKAHGGRVIGTQCSGIPEEIIHAGGMLPIRIRANTVKTTQNADAHLHRINCSYTRSVLESLMSGDLNFLDGYIAANTCDHHLRLSNGS
jgi:benzoyl-CoA reductase subunit C